MNGVPKLAGWVGMIFLGIIVYLTLKRFAFQQKNEVTDSWEAVIEGQQRGEVANLINIMRNPPVAMVGYQPLTVADVSPFSGLGSVTPGQFLPRLQGTDSGATNINGEPQPLVPGLDMLPNNWINNIG